MKNSCNNCGIKDTCLKRTLGIFVLYVQTGRIAELTSEVKEQFCVAEECENWTPKTTGCTLQMEEAL